MKKRVLVLSLLIITMYLNAQITFFGSRWERVYNTETQSRDKDSIISFVADQYNYDEIDMISSRQEEMYPYDGSSFLNSLCLWKNNSMVNDSYFYRMYIRDGVHDTQSNTYDRVWLDSIVWHPISLENVNFSIERDTIPVVELYGSSSRTYKIGIEPHYATISYGVSNSDTSILDASIQKVATQRGTPYFNNELVLTVSPKSIGSTVLTMTFNNSIRKQLEIVVKQSPGVQDETSLPIDSLFTKIYSRLVLTGNQMPGGEPDWKGADEGYMGFYRGLFSLQELSADQLFWVWNDVGIDKLVTNEIQSDNIMVESFFHRLYYNIWLCNSYLKRTENQASLAIKRAEVRFLRTYFYYYLLDMFGNVPIVTENTAFTSTPQSSRKQLYDFVESELLAVEPELSAVGYKEDYYRVDKAAAWMLLSRLYLNAPVFYSANVEYDKAALYAYKVIQSSYDLASHYKWLFMGDNNQRSTTNDAWKEMIFTIPQEGTSFYSWSGSLFLVASMSSSKSPLIGCNGYWECIRSRKQLVDIFFSDPSNAIQGTANELTRAANDDRARFCNYYNGQAWQYDGKYRFGSDAFYAGWCIQKWSNWYSNSGDSIVMGSHPNFPDTDIPLMRKAEAYLNYAEAVARGGAQVGNLTAVDAVNIVRRRANATEIQTISLTDILDERGREFYAEGYRRSDLIRFGKFGGNTRYQWEGKSGEKDGKDFPQYMNLYPIPAALLPSISQGVQNAGY